MYTIARVTLALLCLCAVTKQAASQTEEFDIATECNEQFTRRSDGAVAFVGRLDSTKHERYGCEVGFVLMEPQRNFAFRVDSLVSTKRIKIEVKQYNDGESSNSAKTIFQKTFANSSGYTVSTLNSSPAKVQMIIISFPDHEYDHDYRHGSVNVDIRLLLTPHYQCDDESVSVFQCSSYCIQKSLECDQYANCPTASDENMCTEPELTTVTPFPMLNDTTSKPINGTVVLVIFWWYSWYAITLMVIGGILLLCIMSALVFCICGSLACCCSKKSRVSSAPSSPTPTPTSSRYAAYPSVDPPACLQVTVEMQNKARDQLPPTYREAVQSPPAYVVAVETPCGHSQPL